MTRTVINAHALDGAYPSLPYGSGGADFALTANSDATDRSTPIVDGKTLLIAYNSDSADHTITITSFPDSFNRTGDIATYTVAAGKISRFGPFKLAGWSDAGSLDIDVSDAHILISVVTLP